MQASANSILPDRPPARYMLLFLVLLALGSATLWFGSHVIRTHHYEFSWEEERSVGMGPIGISPSQARGIDRFDGAAADFIGVGFLCLGSMLGLWGLAGAWAIVRPATMTSSVPGPSIWVVSSLILQTAALAFLFPPRLERDASGLILWVTIALYGIMILICSRFGGSYVIRGIMTLLLALFATGFIAGSVFQCRGWVVGIVMGTFAALSYAMHGFVILLIRQRTTATRPSSPSL